VYVSERPLTFNDLATAVRNSAGLGDVTLDFPFGTPTEPSDTFSPNDPTYAAQSGSTLPPSSVPPLTSSQQTFLQTGQTSPAMPWGTLGLAVAGLILFGLVVGKR
jgi:hypothetical protein